jgi:hypothetical protein
MPVASFSAVSSAAPQACGDIVHRIHAAIEMGFNRVPPATWLSAALRFSAGGAIIVTHIRRGEKWMTFLLLLLK